MKKQKAANRRFFLNILSLVSIIYGISAIPPFAVALYAGEAKPALPLGIAGAFCIIAGASVRPFCKAKDVNIRPRIYCLTTMMCWLIITVLTAAVFFFGLEGATVTGAFFDASASLTTTGTGSVGADMMPHSLLLWRSVLNWLGGIGFILIAVTLLGNRASGCHTIVIVEMPGPEYLKTSSTYRKTYRNILSVYAGLTAVHFVLLLIAGMGLSDSVMTALSNISTSGLYHLNNDISGLSAPLKAIITLFSFLGALNFSFFLLVFIHSSRRLHRESETFGYTVRLIVTALVIAAILVCTGKFSFSNALGDSVMQTVSFLTTSGYKAADCTSWPLACQMIILLELFFGACSVSTGGGIKAARLRISARTVSFGLYRHIHPKAVRPVKYQGKAVFGDWFINANLYVALFFMVYICAAALLSLDNKSGDLFDALHLSQAMLTNTGTTISDLVYPVPAPYISPLSRIVMSFEMLCGRLEIYPVLMMFTKGFWKGESRF